MPIVEFPEFEQFKAQGYKGVFVGGCIRRGDGSSFRAKAHAHCYKRDKLFGWICIRSAKRLYTRPGQPSNLMWHELCHILTPNHSHDDVWRAKAKQYGVYIGKRYKKKRRPIMANAAEVKEKDGAAVYNKEDITLSIQKATGDPDAQRMGPAKDGGSWYKNSAGTCYRVDEDGKGGYEVKETKQATNATKKKIASGPSRAEMMKKAKEKKIKYFRILNKLELSEALKENASEVRIKELQAVAIKRWHDGGSKTA
jgi:hypothetical protein